MSLLHARVARRERYNGPMGFVDVAAPSGHTPAGGVMVGSSGAGRQMVLYEDPQCPYCRRFERRCGDMLRREVAAGAVAVEYRMRCFLGPESVRADNALALAAEEGRFDQLRALLFANQPPEQTGGFRPADLLELGEGAGLTSANYTRGVRDGRYEPWVQQVEEIYQLEDPGGTPFAILDGVPVDSADIYDPEALGALIRA
ncbi:MAG TPA: thioredoxin domain-containing protein [Acidimicrobiales bacterium]|nr:thioredoxin domain-containing protein [Acidimicrobiales bacterium]